MAFINKIVKEENGVVTFWGGAVKFATLTPQAEIKASRGFTVLRITDANGKHVEFSPTEIEEIQIKPNAPENVTGVGLRQLWSRLSNEFFAELYALDSAAIIDASDFGFDNLTQTLNFIRSQTPTSGLPVTVVSFIQRLETRQTQEETPSAFITLTVQDMTPGAYIIAAFAELDVTAQTRSAGAQVRNVTDSKTLFKQITEKKESINNIIFSGFQIDTITTQEDKIYNLEFYKTPASGGAVVSISNGCLIILKIG